MPILSQFRGISIYMYSEPGVQHRLPHFHAYYGEHAATFAITPPDQLEGTLPRTQLRLVLAWAELYQREIDENWRLIQAGQAPKRIPGL